jgi:hypothetical protein
MSPQQMQPERKRKAKPKVTNAFDADKVFEMKPAQEIELDTESALYKAQQGEGGDRRS